MRKLINFSILFISNIIYTNYFFLKFEQSDYSIAIKGLNNFSEDLNDLGFPAGLKIKYLYFAILVALLVTIIIYYFVLSNFKSSDPLIILKSILQIAFVNSSILIIVLYIFRFFNFPRVYILINIILYPIVMSFLIFILRIYFGNVKKFTKLSIIFLPIVLILSIYLLIDQLSTEALATKYFDTEGLTNEVDIIIPINDQDGLNCYKWSGSENYKGCKNVKQLKKISIFNENQINNFVIFESDLFTVLRSGIVLRNSEVFLDISENVSAYASEQGLYDIVFHPIENYFLISFSNLLNDLEIVKYDYDENFNISFNESVLRIPNSSFNHFCGSLIWSEYFNSFLYCVGDLGEERLSLSTNVKNGKILLLNNKTSLNVPLISDSENQPKLENILAYGLRNPWNFFEHDNLLVIPDVGNKSMEEVNFVELDSLRNNLNSILFGWPVYEGTILSDNRFYGLKLWESSDIDLYNYVKDKSSSPRIFYDRPAPENNRAAILGTIVFENPDSDFNENFIFADFLSKEIFTYNYKTNELFILNLPYFPGYLTSIGNHPTDRNKILISTSNNGDSEVYELELP